MTKHIGKIPEEYLTDNIKWLVVVPHVHENRTVGYYMYFHEDINQSAIWDNWYQSLDDALEHGADYGINKEDWQIENLN